MLEFLFWVKGINAFLFSFVDEIIFDCKVAIPYYKALIDSSLNLKNDKSNGNLISPLKSIKLKANAAFRNTRPCVIKYFGVNKLVISDSRVM